MADTANRSKSQIKAPERGRLDHSPSSLAKLLKGPLAPVLKELGKNKLVSLDLASSDLHDADIAAISSFFLLAKGLKSVRLANNKLTDEGVKTLCNILSQNQVQSVDLSQNVLTIESVQLIANFAITNKKLRHVSLRHNHIGNISKERLVADFKNIGVALDI